MDEKQDVYARVTDKIIADLERGELTWVQPWKAGHVAGPVSRPLRSTGEPYRGINILSLWATAMEKGYVAPIWMTFKQAKDLLTAHVRKGEKGALVVYANIYQKKEQGEGGEEILRDVPFLKGYTVFNVEQIDGLPPHFYARAEPVHETPIERDEACERFFGSTGAVINHGGNRAFYRIKGDFVQMPDLEAFKDAQSYYATAAHEITHWTRHPSRLDRDFGQKRFGDEKYALEELVAEIGAAFLCADLGIANEAREDHAAYIASWLKALKDDKKFIFVAASHAQQAVDYLHGLQPQPVRNDPENGVKFSSENPALG